MGPTVGVHGGSVLPTTPRHPRADSPVYVGWVQVVPESKEKYTPDVPTSGVNGHVLSSPALHASRSMLSFAPAARIVGLFASIATAGSFCLFCENGLVGLPTLTRVSGLNAAAGSAVDSTNNAAETSKRQVRLTIAMLLSSGGPQEQRETRRPYRRIRLIVKHAGATARSHASTAPIAARASRSTRQHGRLLKS